MPTFRVRQQTHLRGDKRSLDTSSPSSMSGPLERTYEQCYREAKSWFYVSVVAAIVASITMIVMIVIIVNAILLRGLTSVTFIATLASVITSMINGGITYLVFSQKRYANERVDSYADKINCKVNEEADGEKIRTLIEIVLESHLTKEDQSNLIKEIIARKALLPVAEMRQNKGML